MLGRVLMMAALVSGPAADDPSASSFSPGIGFTVSQQLREADQPPVGPRPPTEAESAQARTVAASSEPSEPDPSASGLAPRLPPPPSDLARAQGSPRARGLHAAAAIAAQMAMIVAGAVAVRDQRRRAREAQRGRAPPYKPYR